MQIERLIDFYPRLYHMAEVGTWDSIRERGLLSTSATLDLFGLENGERAALESTHRREMMAVGSEAPTQIVLRDQRPMPPGRLQRALTDGTTPDQWYRLINSKVFFWAERHRLLRLLNAYGEDEHDVLTIDTRSLVNVHAERIRLCHMNSGNTLPIPHHRGGYIFQRIEDYPVKRNGKPQKPVVEVVVEYSVPDIADHVIEVHRMQREETLGKIWVRS